MSLVCSCYCGQYRTNQVCSPKQCRLYAAVTVGGTGRIRYVLPSNVACMQLLLWAIQDESGMFSQAMSLVCSCYCGQYRTNQVCSPKQCRLYAAVTVGGTGRIRYVLPSNVACMQLLLWAVQDESGMFSQAMSLVCSCYCGRYRTNQVCSPKQCRLYAAVTVGGTGRIRYVLPSNVACMQLLLWAVQDESGMFSQAMSLVCSCYCGRYRTNQVCSPKQCRLYAAVTVGGTGRIRYVLPSNVACMQLLLWAVQDESGMFSQAMSLVCSCYCGQYRTNQVCSPKQCRLYAAVTVGSTGRIRYVLPSNVACMQLLLWAVQDESGMFSQAMSLVCSCYCGRYRTNQVCSPKQCRLYAELCYCGRYRTNQVCSPKQCRLYAAVTVGGTGRIRYVLPSNVACMQLLLWAVQDESGMFSQAMSLVCSCYCGRYRTNQVCSPKQCRLYAAVTVGSTGRTRYVLPSNVACMQLLLWAVQDESGMFSQAMSLVCSCYCGQYRTNQVCSPKQCRLYAAVTVGGTGRIRYVLPSNVACMQLLLWAVQDESGMFSQAMSPVCSCYCGQYRTNQVCSPKQCRLYAAVTVGSTGRNRYVLQSNVACMQLLLWAVQDEPGMFSQAMSLVCSCYCGRYRTNQVCSPKQCRLYAAVTVGSTGRIRYVLPSNVACMQLLLWAVQDESGMFSQAMSLVCSCYCGRYRTNQVCSPKQCRLYAAVTVGGTGRIRYVLPSNVACMQLLLWAVQDESGMFSQAMSLVCSCYCGQYRTNQVCSLVALSYCFPTDGNVMLLLISHTLDTLCYCLSVCGWVGGWVVFIVSYALHLLILGSCYTAHKGIVNIMKVYIKRNNIQVELIRFRKK